MRSIKDSAVNIYIVDDDEFHLKILKSKFQTSTGYNLFTFTSGEDLLYFMITQPLNKRLVHVVLLDYLLKTKETDDRKNGNEILQIIRGNYPGVEVLMLSNILDVDVAALSMKLGAATFIKKNENSFTRIHNNIKWIISEKLLERNRKASFLTFYLFISILVILTFLFGIIYRFFSELLVY